ncbi:MAG: FapA family protein [Lachnospiraceae bacterium]
MKFWRSTPKTTDRSPEVPDSQSTEPISEDDNHHPFHDLDAFSPNMLASLPDADVYIAQDAPLDHTSEEEEDIAPVLPPKDATVHVWATNNFMSVYMVATPPSNGGLDITKDQLMIAIKEAQVTTNIDYKLLVQIISEKMYNQTMLIASGTLPVPGEDGKIIDYFSRLAEIRLKEDDKGTIDFKHLNMIQNIKKGTVICDIIHPVEGIDGIDVTGKKLPARASKQAHIPAGQNTCISPDGNQVLASSSGHVIFEGSNFNVYEKLVIKSDVDSSVGNLDFDGDIEIFGDVHSGFTLIAEGNIITHGLVEGATLTAGGNISVLGGVNGNMQGILRAGGDIVTRFLENCTAYADGSIYAESMINSQLFCNNALSATKGKGIIIGCHIWACTVDAKIIGTLSNHLTDISLGLPFNLAQKRKQASHTLAELNNTYSQMQKNIIYLTSLHTLSKQKEAILKNLTDQKALYETKISSVTKQIMDYDNYVFDIASCHVCVTNLNPPVRITIGTTSRSISEPLTRCNIYLSSKAADDIVIGTY